MKTQLVLNVITEQSLSLISRLLLILNRKQLELISMKVDSNYSNGYYKYNFHVSGSDSIISHAIKLISKQIGVFDVKTNAPVQHQDKKAALV